MIIVSPAFRKTSFSKCFLSQFTEAPKGHALIRKDGLVWTLGLTIEIMLCFRDGLVWTVGLTVEIKLCFRDRLVWTVGPTVETKPRFRDGLVWKVGLAVEIKLRFQIYIWSIIEGALAWCLSAYQTTETKGAIGYQNTLKRRISRHTTASPVVKLTSRLCTCCTTRPIV